VAACSTGALPDHLRRQLPLDHLARLDPDVMDPGVLARLHDAADASPEGLVPRPTPARNISGAVPRMSGLADALRFY
jgi:hypothetical protein